MPVVFAITAFDFFFNNTSERAYALSNENKHNFIATRTQCKERREQMLNLHNSENEIKRKQINECN